MIMMGDWKLIFYHETGKNELYNVAKDEGEVNDLAAGQPERTKAMRAKLDAWLKETKAKFPKKDPQHDPAKQAAYLEGQRTNRKAKLEAQHKRFLDADYQPNKDWWGSSPAK